MRHRSDYAYSDQPINWRILRSLLPYLMEFRGRVALAVVFLTLAKLANVAVPVALKYIVDHFDPSVEAALVAIPLGLLLAYGLLRFGSVFFGELRDAVFARVAERAMRRVSLRVFEHLHRMDLGFHLSRRTGGLTRDIERGTTGISFLLRFTVFNIIPTLLEIAMVAVILMLILSPGFAVTMVLSVGIYVIFSIFVTEWRNRFVREANQMDNRSNTRAVDSLLNYETVKYFGNEAFEARRYDADLEAWESARMKNRLSLAALNSGQALIIAGGITVMMIMASSRVAAGEMTVGDLVMVNAYMIQLFIPLNFLGFVYREIRESLINIERLFGLMDKPPKVVDRPGAGALVADGGEIRFTDVCFGYGPDRRILDRVSFHVPAGHKVAIVGASGAGKSTLARLLFRFYDVDQGSICIHGQDIRDVTQDSLRAAIGVVPQDTVLFNDSIRYNIAYGCPGATEAAVRRAARLAHLEDFIARLPQGYDTVVGERGLKLSGGEKQRIAIARVILKDPPILILDEATSSLDSHSEQAIMGALKEIARARTTLAIAHRLSTIQDADHIIVLDQGQVVEQGTHDALLARQGVYAGLWQSQLQQSVK
ncbi:ABCB family ABC transporter ATP-binding protein/permease [Ectothiorhodospira shaposhnikovii]|uniref:ABCB family ABC transporter ATP-binding protein/permease n=1 Tax=Ectothiorhodospira shaposhnikovii TaxID=1054 RepID=UPI001EE7CF4F|nr:ABC transporter ATP-binding protein/permease [Ectothiorhodospira shaposhnikovii]